MSDFVDEKWREILAFNGLESFDALWNVDAKWFEEPNRRRGGWSGVSRYEMRLPEGNLAPVFIKRQENHGTWSWAHPIRGVPTFLREFQRIMTYRRCEIPSLQPVYFGARLRGGDQRAILITEDLAGFYSLEAYGEAWLKMGLHREASGQPSLEQSPRYSSKCIGIISATVASCQSMSSYGSAATARQRLASLIWKRVGGVR